MSEKIACTACGTMILATTAVSNGGLCMPCRRGTRQNIEDSKRRYAERKAAQANPDPATKHWRWLVGEVYSPDGFARLSQENQNYFAACLLEGEVYNGGFDQYFHNSSADFYPHALRGLEAIGATECSRVLIGAKEAVFGARDVPDNQAARFAHMRRGVAAREEKLEELDRSFGKAAAAFRDLVAQYAEKHRLFDGF